MGLFDKIVGRAVGTAIGKVVGDAVSNAINNNTAAVQAAPAQSAAQPDPKYNNVSPAKPSRIIKDVIYDTLSDNTDVQIPYSFNLSGDFIESQSHAGEINLLYFYAPESDKEFIGDSEGLDNGYPYFMVANADSKVYGAIEEFRKSGTVSGAKLFEKTDGNTLFKAKMPYYKDEVIYFHALVQGNLWNHSCIAVVYKNAITGTKLEEKLTAAVDAAAATYKTE